MRQLNTEGFMHNRTRMIVANFLTKDLHLHWSQGEEYFMDHLADGDVAVNNGGWQWCAGTGNDAQPWFRIFNPLLQSRRFDPDATYIKKYIPELLNVDQRYIHAPWLMSHADQHKSGCRIGKEYPSPIVDHENERKLTLQLYNKIAKKT
jgi:deoxyribodipyrimidine photo-lyase